MKVSNTGGKVHFTDEGIPIDPMEAAHAATRERKPWLTTPKCNGVRKDGGRCGGFAGEDGFCFQHSPKRSEEEKHAQRVAAGRASGVSKRAYAALVPSETRRQARELADAIRDVRAGNLDPRRLTAMAAGVNAYSALIGRSQLEDRIKAMEQAMADEDLVVDGYAEVEVEA